jgi:hypothetical protein
MRWPRGGRRTGSRTKKDYGAEIEARGKRIRALRGSFDMPGAPGGSGYSTQVSALEHLHRSAGADYVRFTSVPEDEEDWKRLRERLDEAIEQMDADLASLEGASGASKR